MNDLKLTKTKQYWPNSWDHSKIFSFSVLVLVLIMAQKKAKTTHLIHILLLRIFRRHLFFSKPCEQTFFSKGSRFKKNQISETTSKY
ncbi:hypothetical protein BpHYR1_030963 [Brachionus plicatilis]|uniref:Uncharacterized protein n=1 Tax=Brachionus plicatilis TaxID=10195 RepID=A0A3M7SW63_BRAPC|nr:hypothetical protein BpHYR1_030963 [Brachionus plicatilis]